MEAERVPVEELEERSYEEEVLRFYKLAKHAEWQVRDLPWGDKPPIPETRGTPSPQREARRRDLDCPGRARPPALLALLLTTCLPIDQAAQPMTALRRLTMPTP